MTLVQDSVVSALDDLRQQERSRLLLESNRTRELADVARRQADAAERRRREAKRNAEELETLRQRVADDAEERVVLEARVHQLQAASRMRSAPPPPEVHLVTAPQRRSHHLVWTATLLISCLGVFLATYSPSAPPPAPVAAAVLAPVECPEARAVPESNDQAPELAPTPTPAPTPTTAEAPKRPRPLHKGPREPRPTPVIHIDTEGCDGPLCGLPD